MFYQEVFEELNKRGVRYLVVGGVAVSLHGVPRMTYDLDLMIGLESKNVLRTWDALIALGFSPRVPITKDDLSDGSRRKELRLKKNMLVASFFKGERQFDVVDILVDNPIDFEECYERRAIYRYEIHEVPLIAIEDLIRLKSLANRQQDVADIQSLKKLQDRKSVV